MKWPELPHIGHHALLLWAIPEAWLPGVPSARTQESIYQAGGRLSRTNEVDHPQSLFSINTCLVQLSPITPPPCAAGCSLGPAAQCNLLSSCSNISSFAAY